MSVVAVIRADDFDLPLFLHVLGAMAMVGALALAANYLFIAKRDGSLEAARVGFRALLYAVLPAFIVMRVGAQWIADKEGVADSDAAWIGIGYGVSDAGLALILGATLAAGVAFRKIGRGEAGSRGTGIAAWIVAVLIVLYVVAIWAMATKPV